MNEQFRIKRNDTSPAIKRKLLDSDGNVINLTGASVRFYMSDKVAADATILNAIEGIVSYDWQDGDTDTSGVHNAEFEVVYADGTKETFPNDSNIIVVIASDLGEPV